MKMKNFSIIVVLLVGIIIVGCHDHSRNHHHGHQHHHHEHQHHHHQHDHQHHHHEHDHDHNHDHQHHDHHHHQHTEQQQTNQNQQHHHHKHTHPKQPLQLKMIQNKPHLLQSLKLTQISIFFYGSAQTPQYQQFQALQPSYNSQFYESLPYKIDFYYLPADKFKLSRPNPSLSIFRKINNGEWLFYKGIFQRNQMKKWIIKNTVDPLKELTGEEMDSFFIDSKKGFILLEFGQFHLLKTKIMLGEFCKKYDLMCGKVTHKNKVIGMAIQLMRAQKQPGVPKIGYWNPKSQQLQIYTKDPSQITQIQLMQLYSGHESVIPYQAQIDVGEQIHPQTQFVQINEPKMDVEL